LQRTKENKPKIAELKLAQMSNPPASKTEISMTDTSSPFHPIKKIIVQSLGMARSSSLALHCTTPPAQEESKVMPCPAIDAIQSN
jgi:hypothetical protein